MEHNFNIKSMKLYHHVNRIYNELDELGKINSDPLNVEEFRDGRDLGISFVFSGQMFKIMLFAENLVCKRGVWKYWEHNFR